MPLLRGTSARLGTRLMAGVLLLGASAMPARASKLDAPEIPVIEVDSMFVSSQASNGRALERPTGIAFDTFGHEIVVANTGLGRVEFFGLDGRPHGSFVHRVPGADGQMRDGAPKSVAIDARGRLMVSDNLTATVDLCDFRGRSIGSIALPAPDDRIDHGDGPVLQHAAGGIEREDEVGGDQQVAGLGVFGHV